MRILYLTTGCFDKGGISRYSRYQIAAIRQLVGDENVRALSILGPDEHAFEEPIDLYWHGTDARSTTLGKTGFAAQALKLAAVWKPDVIHAAHVNLTPLVRSLATVCRAATCLNVYGLEIWSGLSRVRRAAVKSMGHIVADCVSTARYVCESGLHARQPTVIWDCVDLDRFSPGRTPTRVLQKYGIPSKDEHFVVASLGRLTKNARHKGFDRLIRVFAAVCKRDSAARLVIGGRGDDQSNLKSLAEDLEVSDRVHFIGAVDEADLPDVYRAASVFSLISDRGVLRGEGLPLVVLEAMACGVPILVGNQDGSREAVVGARNGFVFDPFDLAAQGDALYRMGQDRDLLARMQAEARLVAVENFGYERFCAQHDALYTQLQEARKAYLR